MSFPRSLARQGFNVNRAGRPFAIVARRADNGMPSIRRTGNLSIAEQKPLIVPVLLGAGGLGVAPLAKKAALTAGAAPAPLAFTTTLVAAFAAIAFLLGARGLRGLVAPRGRAYLHVFLVGFLGSGAVALLAVIAMTGTTATNRGLFQSMYPVATAVAARALLGERLRRLAYLVIGCMTLGLLAMNLSGGDLRLGPPFWLLTLTLPLIGLSDVYARRTLDDADPAFVTVGRLVSGALGLALVLPWVAAEQWVELRDAAAWIGAAGVATTAGLVGLYRAMDTAGASLAAAFAALAPVVTVSLEWVVLGATFSVSQLAGVAIVVAGGAALALAGSKARK
jgi:drug/metabolite transporter (DMT)-like permease